MTKYIDAEQLITKIKELNLVTKTYEEQVAFNNALAMVVEIITSLQQERKEVDLERDAVQFCFDNGLNVTPYQAKTIASHFYELGENGK